VAERVLELGGGEADRVEIRNACEPWSRPDRVLQLRGCNLRLLDALRRLRQAQLHESGTKVAEVAAPGAFLRQLAHGRDGDRLANERAIRDRAVTGIEGEPRLLLSISIGAQVHPRPGARLRRHDALELLTLLCVEGRGLNRRGNLLLEAHSCNNSPVTESLSERNRAAQALFAPLGETYDRYARLLSFGQDPRWRSFLVGRIEAAPDDTVLDVACGTAAVSLELVRRYGCWVVGIDQSAEMLAAGRSRIEAAGYGRRIELQEGQAETLPFDDASFDALTFTYLLRYVDDPARTMKELARVVRPGGRIAMLDFFVPERLARPAWELYVRVGLPVLGRAISPGWGEVGDFLGPSIRGFWAEHPVDEIVRAWNAAGIGDVRGRRLSLGGGIVLWGTRGA
jgi:demethylmenaquinone methyltransferase / 2-methoxy-6-polyprenyl-1,4-benzoquinol methylase